MPKLVGHNKQIMATVGIMSAKLLGPLRGTTLQWLLLTCHCQTNREPVLRDPFSRFSFVADAAEWGAARFSSLSGLRVVALLSVFTQYSCIGLLW
jgi:hypothetical protein